MIEFLSDWKCHFYPTFLSMQIFNVFVVFHNIQIFIYLLIFKNLVLHEKKIVK